MKCIKFKRTSRREFHKRLKLLRAANSSCNIDERELKLLLGKHEFELGLSTLSVRRCLNELYYSYGDIKRGSVLG